MFLLNKHDIMSHSCLNGIAWFLKTVIKYYYGSDPYYITYSRNIHVFNTVDRSECPKQKKEQAVEHDTILFILIANNVLVKLQVKAFVPIVKGIF